jgi:glycosyl transferase family 25
MNISAPASAADSERFGGVLPLVVPAIAASADRGLSFSTFYINRACDSARRASIERELSAAGLDAERIDAVNGLAVPEALQSYFFLDGRVPQKMKPGEIGCYASHLKALALVRELGVSCALILEDDASLPPGLVQTIEGILARLPKNWDFVHLGRDSRHAVKAIGTLADGRALVRYSRVPSGTFGYLISERGAAKFLRPCPRDWPLDTDYRRPWKFGLEIYGVAPSIIGHFDAFESSIGAVGGRGRGRRGVFTANPFYGPAATVFNFKVLGPGSWTLCWMRNLLSGSMRLLAR